MSTSRSQALFATVERRVRLVAGPTPLQRLSRLQAVLHAELGRDVPELWVKRDDLTGLAGGGNKTRKLELLLREALDAGADTVVTIGAVQSNHARQTVAAANQVGLDTHLVLEVPAGVGDDYLHNGNLLLDRLLGAEIAYVDEADDSADAAQTVLRQLTAQGRRPVLIPVGGSSALGSLGYVLAFDEIARSAVAPDLIVVASGSAGTQAGLIAGAQLAGADIEVLGVTVSRTVEQQLPKVLDLSIRTHALATGRPDPDSAGPSDETHDSIRSRVLLDDRFVGPGYGVPTDAMREAVALFARTEGLLLDPVYTGKAAAGLIQRVREGSIPADQRVVFLHTGGAPGLYAYRDALLP